MIDPYFYMYPESIAKLEISKGENSNYTDEYYQCKHKIPEEYVLEFEKLFPGNKNKFKFRFHIMQRLVWKYEYIYSEVVSILETKFNLKNIHPEKILRFFQIIHEKLMFLEKKRFAMGKIFHSAYLKHKKALKKTSMLYESNDYKRFISHMEDVRIFEEDYPHITITTNSYELYLGDIFNIQSNWSDFPNNLSKHKFQIFKIIYRSLKNFMIGSIVTYNIKYYLDDVFFNKWEKRGVNLASDYDNVTGILFHVSFSNNCDTSATMIALNHAMNRLYYKKRGNVLRKYPDLWLWLENIREGMDIPEMTELIYKSIKKRWRRFDNYYTDWKFNNRWI
jgi:hypothetical protein